MDASHGSTTTVNQEEEAIMKQMARSGVPTYPWNDVLEPLLERRMIISLEEFRNSTQQTGNEDAYRAHVAELQGLLRSFNNAPFTLQRICELIMNPKAHYKTLDALLRGYEILLSVTSTIPVVPLDEVVRLEHEYQRVIATAVPGAQNQGADLRRTDTVEMDVEA